jgi:hypothetical protein
MCNNDVEFEQINMKISQKNIKILEKYGKGAIARRVTNKMKIQSLKEITGKCILLNLRINFFVRSAIPLLPRRCQPNHVVEAETSGRRSTLKVS